MNISKILVIIIIVLVIFIISACLFGILRFFANKEHYDTQQIVAEHIFNDIYNNRRDRLTGKVEENPQLVKEEIQKERKDFIMV